MGYFYSMWSIRHQIDRQHKILLQDSIMPTSTYFKPSTQHKNAVHGSLFASESLDQSVHEKKTALCSAFYIILLESHDHLESKQK